MHVLAQTRQSRTASIASTVGRSEQSSQVAAARAPDAASPPTTLALPKSVLEANNIVQVHKLNLGLSQMGLYSYAIMQSRRHLGGSGRDTDSAD